MERVYILDTTLRDGLQSPEISLTIEEKIEVAKLLLELQVDVIDAGYPSLGHTEFNAVNKIAEFVGDKVTVSALAKVRQNEIESAIKALQPAKNKRIHLYTPVSPIHLAILDKAREKELKDLEETLSQLKKEGFEVEVTLEDATRADEVYLNEVLDAILLHPVNVINIADTVGIGVPESISQLVKKIKDKAEGKSLISIHCHNDLGMATANTVSAILAGARQAHVTLLGIGTRAGNAALEEVVVTLYTLAKSTLTTNINLKSINKAIKSFSKITGYPIYPHKPIVGKSVFSHKTEYMQIAVVREKKTFEIIDPETIGVIPRRIVLSRHSGKPIFKEKLIEMGFNDLTDKEIEKAFEKFKELAKVKQSISEEDIEAIVEDTKYEKNKKIKVVSYNIFLSSSDAPKAYVEIEYEGNTVKAEETGDGPIDAAFKAINSALGLNPTLLDYSIKSITHGKESLGEVFLKVKIKGKEFTGRAVSTDIIKASIEAYIRAANKSLIGEERLWE